MENDVKKVSRHYPLDSSNLLTDWLLKYKLDNISYLSAPPIQPQTIKTPRKGQSGLLPLDSRDIIRPTTQLFKYIRSKSRKRNDSPSPPRSKVCSIPSPAKEANKIFSHKETQSNILENYRKHYTYARVKLDKVSREKIESAVALFRQREQEKENALANKHAPAKRKKVETNPIKSPKKEKNAISHEKVKKNLNNDQNSQTNQNEGSEDKGKEINSRENNQEVADKNNFIKKNKKIKSMKGNLKLGTNPQSETLTLEKVIIDKVPKDLKIEKSESRNKLIIRLSDQVDETGIGNFQWAMGGENDNRSIKGTKIQVNIARILNKTNNFDRIKVLKESSAVRSMMIKDGFKRKEDKSEIGGDSTLLSRRSVTASTDNYISVQPAVKKNESSLNSSKKLSKVKSIDDLLKEYRLKYRNMIKLR